MAVRVSIFLCFCGKPWTTAAVGGAAWVGGPFLPVLFFGFCFIKRIAVTVGTASVQDKVRLETSVVLASVVLCLSLLWHAVSVVLCLCLLMHS